MQAVRALRSLWYEASADVKVGGMAVDRRGRRKSQWSKGDSVGV